MKKLSFILAIAGASMVTMVSCHKERMTIVPPVTMTQTISATENENTTYTFVLPPTVQDGSSRISIQPTHAGSSVITKDAYGSTVYQYTPAQSFAGADELEI